MMLLWMTLPILLLILFGVLFALPILSSALPPAVISGPYASHLLSPGPMLPLPPSVLHSRLRL